MNIPPPVKLRLERESRFGSLTRGYLRVLLEQVITFFYIHSGDNLIFFDYNKSNFIGR